ncbi:hypothetical protein [Actinomyces culturomici]|uniref:hypothetical protein n=1 Tax=Actinomyces culturomici TaxID=1926276 RepID=UPI000E209305|nr:hypothetical protein [Actinomyces culturomici]
MASIDRKGSAPVLVLDEAEYTILTAVCQGALPAAHRRARPLRKAGMLDEDGPTPECAPILEGLSTARRRFAGAVMHAGGGRQTESWIGEERVTGVLIEGDAFRLHEVDPCDTPSLTLPLLDLRPRESIDFGHLILPGEVVELIDRGDVDRLESVLARIAADTDRGGAPGAPDGPSPLTLSFAQRTWVVSVLQCIDRADEDWEMSDIVATLSVPECLYELAYDDTRGEAITRLAPISSLAVWTRISSWFFPRR